MTNRRFVRSLVAASFLLSFLSVGNAFASPALEAAAATRRPWTVGVAFGVWTGSEDALGLERDVRAGRLVIGGPIALAVDLSLAESSHSGKVDAVGDGETTLSLLPGIRLELGQGLVRAHLGVGVGASMGITGTDSHLQRSWHGPAVALRVGAGLDLRPSEAWSIGFSLFVSNPNQRSLTPGLALVAGSHF